MRGAIGWDEGSSKSCSQKGGEEESLELRLSLVLLKIIDYHMSQNHCIICSCLCFIKFPFQMKNELLLFIELHMPNPKHVKDSIEDFIGIFNSHIMNLSVYPKNCICDVNINWV